VECLGSPTIALRGGSDFAQDFDDVDLLAEVAAEIFSETLHDRTNYFARTASGDSQVSAQPQLLSS